MSNPLIDDLDPTIPFDRIRAEHFLPALEHHRKIAEGRLAGIKSDTDEPNFDSTILAIETAAEELAEVSSAFYVLFGAEAGEEIQKIAPDVSSFMADFGSDLFLDRQLFDRVRHVYETKRGVDTPEKERLLDLTYRNYRRNGALLSSSDKERLRILDQELSRLSPAFSENVLRATNAFRLHLEDPASAASLPSSLREQAAARAASEKTTGWVFTLQAPDYLPFMTYCSNRSLRERMYRAFRSRGLGSDSDNRPIIDRLLHLRKERALLLGYRDHPAYVLEERMAERPEVVTSFLDGLLGHVLPAAQKEMEELRAFAKDRQPDLDDLQPWDVRYFSEKLKMERYSFDQESLRVYFPLDRVLSGLFEIAGRLYGLRFTEKQGVPVYHPEVRVFDVEDNDGFLGLFYLDLFPRETKKSGAWMTAIREQGLFRGRVVRPHVGIVCNFTRPSSAHPSLLVPDEVRTLFHEFGHALHGLLSKATYRSLAGTNVYWDFVELPSQIMENWTREKEALDVFAAHFETGERIPGDLLQRMKAAENFQAGLQFLTQLNYAYLDMVIHSTDPDSVGDLIAFERRVTGPTTLIPDPGDLSFAAGFSHIFAGGYSAGYYSYKWAEALEADAFDLFRERGIFDPATADSFRRNILEKGNTEPPMDLYVRFRGRQPDPVALLRRDGLAT